jgi:glutathione S-transferase
MIRLYFHPTPNPAKIALFLEEAGLPYELIPIDTSKGEQHARSFRAINPNGKVPAIVDTEGPGGRNARVFDSTAILIYLAEKTGKFLGSWGWLDRASRVRKSADDPLGPFPNLKRLFETVSARSAVPRARAVASFMASRRSMTRKPNARSSHPTIPWLFEPTSSDRG